MLEAESIVIIGGGHAAAPLCAGLAAAGLGARVHLVCEEAMPPYQRPPLSKSFLKNPQEQVQAHRAIAGSLRGFICQKLIPALEGGGRVPSNEILLADATVKNLILEGQFEKIQGLLESSSDSNSFSFNKDLYRLIKAGKISKADGMRFSPNPQALEMNLKGIFIKS